MNSVAPTGLQRGDPRSEADAAFMDRYNARMRLPIVVSAILPLVVVPQSGKWPSVVIGIVTWLVFVLDYVVHIRHLERYAATAFGRFDLFVVLATAPWFLIPGATAGRFVILLRLARIARIVIVSKGSRRLLARLGSVTILAASVVVFGSLVAYYAEHPTNPEFANVGDALWWGIVTLTTVGYGDIVPKTSVGRWAGVTIMITGIGVLGVLSGSLASFFRLDQGTIGSADAPVGDEPASSPAASGEGDDRSGATAVNAALRELTAEVAALRLQVGSLAERLTTTGPAPPGGPASPPSAPGDPPA